MHKITIPITRSQVAILMDIIENISQINRMRYPSHTYMYMFSNVIIAIYGRLKNKHWKMRGKDTYNLKVNRGEAAALWEVCKACVNDKVQDRLLIIHIMKRIDQAWYFALLEQKQKFNNQEEE